MGERGFTLIELVVVMVVVGVLAITALPRFFFRADYDQRGFYDKALATLQFARKAAVASRHHVCVTVNSAANPPYLTVDISTVDPDTISGFPVNCGNNLTLPFQDRDCGSGINNETCAPSGVTLASASFPNGTVIVFDPAGRPGLGGTTTSIGGTMTITGGANTSTITLEQETGYAH